MADAAMARALQRTLIRYIRPASQHVEQKDKADQKPKSDTKTAAPCPAYLHWSLGPAIGVSSSCFQLPVVRLDRQRVCERWRCIRGGAAGNSPNHTKEYGAHRDPHGDAQPVADRHTMNVLIQVDEQFRQQLCAIVESNAAQTP
eukprot:scaffold33517_cov32-Tisochrysis_lutea.AAC.1